MQGFFMHFIYIIYSPSFDRYYVGETEDFEMRLTQHNTGFFGSSSTKYAKDWRLGKLMRVSNCVQARQVEKHIKSMKSKKFLEQLIADEEFFKGFQNLIRERFLIDFIN